MSKKFFSWLITLLVVTLVIIQVWPTFSEDWYASSVILFTIVIVYSIGYAIYIFYSLSEWKKLAKYFSKNIPFDSDDAIFVENAWGNLGDSGLYDNNLTFVFTEKGFYLKVTFNFLFMKFSFGHDLLFIPWNEFAEIRSKYSIVKDFMKHFNSSIYYSDSTMNNYHIKLKKMPNFKFKVLRHQFDLGLRYIPKELIIDESKI